MPPASAALADTVTVPLTLLPALGAVIETVGGVVSPAAATDTVIVVEARLPAASRATADSVWLPAVDVVVFHATE